MSAGWAVAFSGGPDSTALAAGLASQKRDGWALIVDHGLRAESASEAEIAAERARLLGYQTDILRWQGPKPTTGLMEAAREARYRLLIKACRQRGVSRLYLGHQQGDQIETALFRLARQSGWRGMAGMPGMALRGGVQILRPLLTTPKADLLAACKARGLEFFEDPSNRNPRFQRARYRLAEGFAAAGFDDQALAGSLSVWRARRQAELEALCALEGEVWRMEAAGGWARVSERGLMALTDDLRLELLLNLAQIVGQAAYRPSQEARHRLWQDRPGWTLMGCCFTRRRGELFITREPAACAGHDLSAGTHQLYWDNRFDLTLTLDAPTRLAPLGGGSWRGVPGATQLESLPALVRRAFPVIWQGGKVMAIPEAQWRPLYEPLTQNFAEILEDNPLPEKL